MKDKKVFLIANAHIDPVWQWQWQDGFQEIRATFKSVLDRMDEFEDFKFTCAGAMYYEWIQRVDPQMFGRIKKRIEEGRWCVAGGWYLQPDCNLPCGESFAREGLIAQRYFKKTFGFYAKTGYNVDSFGHNGGLVQILKKSGISRYVFMRPDNNEKQIDKSLFIWRGTDGSRIATYRIPFSYCIKNTKVIQDVKALCESENVSQNAFFGVGNHGGGPTIKLLTETDALVSGDDVYKYGSIDDYFEYAEQNGEIAAAQEISGDLQYHSRGCYSLNSAIKEKNRQAENGLLNAEIFSSLAHFAVNAEYPRERLTNGWKRLFFCQFHDNLAGTITKPATQDLLNLFGGIISDTDWDINIALSRISWQIDTLCGNPNDIFRTDTFYPFVHEKLGSPVVIFNPNPYAVRQAVRIFPRCTLVTDYDDKVLPSQLVRGYHTDGKENIYNTIVYLEVPAYGYRTVKIFKEKTVECENPFVCGKDYIETPVMKVTFSKQTGGIKNILDKKSGRQLLFAPAYVCLADETGQDSWMHGKGPFGEVMGKFECIDMHVIEKGPARAAMRVTSALGDNMLEQDFFVYPDGVKVQAKVKITVRDKHRAARFIFPAKVNKNANVISENAFGHIERVADGLEYPCGGWFACFDDCGGVTVANDGKYSFSVDKNECCLTVLRRAIYLDHFAVAAGTRDEFCEYMEESPDEFNYTLTPYTGAEQAVRAAGELNRPLKAVIETFHDGSLPLKSCGISVDADNVIVTAFKMAEDGNGYIVRAYECSGRETVADINVICANTRFMAEFKPFEINTYRIHGGKATKTDILENEI